MKCIVCEQEIDDVRRKDFGIWSELYGPNRATQMENVHMCRDCANKERVKAKVEKYKPIANLISQAVNQSRLGQSDCDAIVELLNKEHRFLQNVFMTFLTKTLFTYGEGSGDPAYEDGRNAWALAWAKAAASLEVHIDQSTGKYVASLPKQ